MVQSVFLYAVLEILHDLMSLMFQEWAGRTSVNDWFKWNIAPSKDSDDAGVE